MTPAELELGAGRTVALRATAVLTPDGWRDDQAVVVRDGRIRSVGPRISSPAEVDGEEDLTGCWLVPAFVDVHWHLSQAGPAAEDADTDPRPYEQLIAEAFALTSQRSAGVLTVRCAHGWVAGASALRRAVLEGTIGGPRIVLAGSLDDPDPANVHAALLRARRHFGEGVDQLSVGSCASRGGEREVVAVAVDEAERRGVSMVGVHAATAREAVAALEAGARLVEGIPEGDADALVDAMVATQAIFVPLLAQGAGRSARELVRHASAAGVRIAAGSAGQDLRSELAALLEAGLGTMQVLDAATRNGAAAAGLGPDAGTIEAGRLADLVALARDPREGDSFLDAGSIRKVYRSSDPVVIGRA